MRYDAFFRAFYIGESDGCLKGHVTTWAIPKFFAEVILPDAESREKLPQDDFSYDKWFQEDGASPRYHWKNFAKYYNEDVFVTALFDAVEETNLHVLLNNFGVSISEGEEINKELLFRAIAQQFKAIIDAKGEAQDIVPDIYCSGNIKADFMDYIHKATQRYNVMRLIGGDEVPLNNFFVCNTIGEKERVFADKQRLKCAYLDDPNLLSIRDMYKKRGYDNLRTILIGSGGCGKSLMLQHLFLKAAEEYSRNGVLPIFVELRHFKQGDDLKDFIVNSVSSKDEKFTGEIAHRLFLSGRCQLLLDGFDEIDPSDVDAFLTKLEKFSDKYDKVQLVITSRDNESLKGLHGFIRLFVWPFDNKQSLMLIEKILTYNNQINEMDTVIDYISNGFLQKDGVFASHPLLLTFVTMNYPIYKRFNDNHLLFYKVTYEALLSGHDDNKKPYDRVFMSVDNAEQFSEVFKQFCAYTYRDGKLQLDSADFENYFNLLTTHQKFKNPHKMNVKNFKHDVCSTACIMYERAYDLFYIDPGFQEYLFADYYAKAETNEVIKLQQALQKVSYNLLLRFDALDMLNNFACEKFKFFVLKPFLDEIYKGDDKQAFMLFLQNCFDEVIIANVNKIVESAFLHKINARTVLYPMMENYPKTILVDYILQAIGIHHDFPFCLRAKFMNKLPDDVEEKGKLIGQENIVDGNKVLLIDAKPEDVYVYYNSMSQKGEDCGFFIDDNRNLVDFGTKISIDSYFLSTEPDCYCDIVANIIENNKDTYEVFQKMKQYHKQLKIDHHRSGYK